MILTVQVSSIDLAFLVKIFEGYSHLAVVKTLDGKQGLAQLIFPTELQEEIQKILANFPRKIQICS